MLRFLAVTLLVGLLGCSGGSTVTPGPTGASATPTPAPTPTPNPYAAACGDPLPSQDDAYGFGVKVQFEPSRFRKVLNASPLVRNSEYCQAVGLPGQFCNTRREDSPQREACDHYMSGISHTGRPGPNWFEVVGDGEMIECGGFGGVPDGGPDCGLNADNQYLLDVSVGGLFRACAGEGTSGTCGGCLLPDSTFGTVHPSPAGLCRADPG